MKDLQQQSGLPISLDETGHLQIDSNLRGGEMSMRKLYDLKEVAQDEITDADRELYYMYRDVHKEEDEQEIRSNNLRYDMTVILPGMIGNEFAKTLGHYHPMKDGQTISYPEVYEVVSGRAFYLLQKPRKADGGYDFSNIEEAYLVEVKAGQKAIMPPDFGHITINIDQEPLVMANWVSSSFQSDYSEIKSHKGGCVFITKSEDGYQVEKNPEYASCPEVKTLTPKELAEFALIFSHPMYQTGMEEVSKLEYLDKPENHIENLSADKVFDDGV